MFPESPRSLGIWHPQPFISFTQLSWQQIPKASCPISSLFPSPPKRSPSSASGSWHKFFLPPPYPSLFSYLGGVVFCLFVSFYFELSSSKPHFGSSLGYSSYVDNRVGTGVLSVVLGVTLHCHEHVTYPFEIYLRPLFNCFVSVSSFSNFLSALLRHSFCFLHFIVLPFPLSLTAFSPLSSLFISPPLLFESSPISVCCTLHPFLYESFSSSLCPPFLLNAPHIFVKHPQHVFHSSRHWRRKPKQWF